MAEFVIITGMSGAGRSTVSNAFEDLGWFVIDNMPLRLVGKVAELVEGPNATIDKVAFVVGRNGPEEVSAADDLDSAVDQLKAAGSRVRIVFLDAPDEVLIRRYEGTRRRHPFAEQDQVTQGIERERRLLGPAKARADVVVDTGSLNVHQLKERILNLFVHRDHATMAVNVVSFGFKHGLPGDVDLVFDLRFLPNPHWVDELRPYTGLDAPVRLYATAIDADLAGSKQFLERAVPQARIIGLEPTIEAKAIVLLSHDKVLDAAHCSDLPASRPSISPAIDKMTEAAT